jgi:hypothetical protein
MSEPCCQRCGGTINDHGLNSSCSMFLTEAHDQPLRDEIERLRAALEGARFKLARYRECHPQDYIGGLVAEYEAQIQAIDAALQPSN